ncbi:MAG: hypothetical protein EBU29_11780, partial [Gammaproteobacteria bacterium]|nr:hypothetical protein [Gammaproteobacteria bacterium]
IREADRRSKTVHFTETGAAFAEDFRRAGEQTSIQLLAGCDPADVEAAIRVFRCISENAECVRIPDKAVI